MLKFTISGKSCVNLEYLVTGPTMTRAEPGIYVIVTPWSVRLYEEIIHELLRVDYLPNRQFNHGITILYHLISVELSQYDFMC